MARRRRYYPTNVEVQRGHFFRPLAPLRAPVYLPTPRLVLTPLEDRRSFHPLRAFRPAASTSRRSQRFLFPSFGSQQLKFAAPRKVIVCIRRQRRREVLHALRKTTSGAGRSRVRNYWSQISCQSR